MGITFDEAIEKIESITDELNIRQEVINDIVSVVEGLRKEYAPTVEMTKNQYLFITSEYEKESVVETVANLTVDDIIKEKFHSNFWAPLSEKQVVKAWLYPETIKVVD